MKQEFDTNNVLKRQSLVKQQYPLQTNNVCNSNTSTLQMKESVPNFHQTKNVIPIVTKSHSCSNLNQSDQIIHSLNNLIHVKHIPDGTGPQMT
jgi:hypothetical protein